MKNLTLTLLSLFLTTQLLAGNLGHRGGSDWYRDLPENSLIVLEASLRGLEGKPPIQYRDNFDYLEFDVQETKDGHLVVFHDSKIKRMLPNSGKNVEVYKQLKDETGKKYSKLKMKYLTLEQVKRLWIWGNTDQKVPTLQEFLDAAAEYGLYKPVSLEIKYLLTQEGLHKAIDILAQFRDDYLADQEIVYTEDFDFRDFANFISFKKKFKKAFRTGDGTTENCNYLMEQGFLGVFESGGKHHNNFCD